MTLLENCAAMFSVELNRDIKTTAISPSTSPVEDAQIHGQLKRYLVFTCVACMYILPFMRLYLGSADEGIFLYGAERIAHGQVFARDFFEIMGPGTFYWVAASFKLLGVSILATRVCLFLTSVGTALLLFYLSCRICRRYQTLPCILLAAVYCGGVWPTVSHHLDSNFFALAAVTCVSLWQDWRRKSLLLTAGVMAALTTAFLQPKGMLLLCALAVWLWIQRRRGFASLSSLSLLAGGYFGVAGLCLLYFWSKRALGDLVYANVAWPWRNYGPSNSVPYAHSLFTTYWINWPRSGSGLWWAFLMSAILIVPFLFVAVLPALLLFIGARSRWGVARPEIMLYWLCGGAIWLAEIHRRDIAHLIFGSSLLVILAIHFLTERHERTASIALQMLSISAACLILFNLCCLLIAPHSVPTRVGSVKMYRDPPALSFLLQHVPPGEEIFVYPYAPQYYFLSSTTNPTPYSGLVNHVSAPSQFRDVARILDQHKVKYVIWDATDSKDAFPSLKQLPSSEPILGPYVESHYNVVWDVNGVRIMERREDAIAN
jgi:hypothetical protein